MSVGGGTKRVVRVVSGDNGVSAACTGELLDRLAQRVRIQWTTVGPMTARWVAVVVVVLVVLVVLVVVVVGILFFRGSMFFSSAFFDDSLKTHWHLLAFIGIGIYWHWHVLICSCTESWGHHPTTTPAPVNGKHGTEEEEGRTTVPTVPTVGGGWTTR